MELFVELKLNSFFLFGDFRFSTSIKQVIATNQEDNEDEDGELINNDNEQTQGYLLLFNIANVHLKDTGNYTCHTIDSNGIVDEQHTYLQSIISARIRDHSPPVIKTKISTSVQLYCLFEAYPMEEWNKSLKWHKDDEVLFMSKMNFPLTNRTQINVINETLVNVTLDLTDVFKKDNGSYVCSITSPYTGEETRFESSLLVLDVPQLSIDYVKAVGSNKIFLNWTVNDGNDPVIQYFVQYLKDNDTTSTYYNYPIDVRNTSYVLDYFQPNTSYQLKMAAKNSIDMGPSYTYPHIVRTLAFDPIFIPIISVKGNTHTTITIGWSPPPAEMLDYVHYYELVVAKADANSSVIEEAMYPQSSRNLPYMFDNLQTATDYKFKVRSCSELTKLCGNWSEEVTGTTSDGTSTEPLNLRISCNHYNISGRTTVSATWDPPAQRNGKINTYQVQLEGLATFRSEKGSLKNETFGPKAKSIDEKLQRAEYENVPSNTNYTLRVSGVTRSKRVGEFAVATCSMPPTVPDIVGRMLWGKVKTENGNWIFKLFLPRISERNGPICGYRIYLVRIGAQDSTKSLPPTPEYLDIQTYHEVHAANNTKGGAYIAEILSNDNFHEHIFLGDGERIRDVVNVSDRDPNEACRKLLNGFYLKPARARTTTVVPPTTDDSTGTIF